MIALKLTAQGPQHIVQRERHTFVLTCARHYHFEDYQYQILSELLLHKTTTNELVFIL